MKRTLLLLMALTLCAAANAQGDAEQYQKQYAKLYKQYTKEPTNVEYNLLMAEYYSDSLNPMRNYASAMNYICRAEELYISIVEDRDEYKEVRRLMRKQITVVSVRQTKQDIIEQSRRFLASDAEISDGELDGFAEAFKSDAGIIRQIESRRLQIKYQQAQKLNTMEAYRDFYSRYATTSEGEEAAKELYRLAKEKVEHAKSEADVDRLLAGYMDIVSVQRAATEKKSALAFATLMAAPTPQAYKEFMRKYPGSDEYAKVMELSDELTQQEFLKLNTPRQYADFALDNPDNPLAEKAIEKLKQMINSERNLQALHIYLEEFPLDVNYNDIYLQYYQWHTEEGNLAPIDKFVEDHPDFPYKMAIQDARDRGEIIDKIELNIPFIEKEFPQWASKVYHLTGRKVSYVALQRTLQHFIAENNWTKAIERIGYFDLSFEDDCIEEVAELKQTLNAPANQQLANTTLVRPAYDLMHPVMHPDGKHLYFDRIINGHSTIQIAQLTPAKKGSVWKGIGEAKFSNLENRDLHIFCLYDDGNSMLLGHDGTIYEAHYTDSLWTVLQMPEPINSKFYDFDAYMLPDGSGILFASDRPESYNMQPSHSYFHGDTAIASDIYFSPRTNKGWGEPVNLGFHVNSPYMECSPSISSDLKTLYFITDGRGGLGYGDIYYTTRDNTNDWTHWAKPTNYGKETNSGFNEASAVLTADGKKIIISSNAHGRYGCYSVAAQHTLNNSFKNVTIATPSVGITIDIVDIASKKNVVSSQTIEQGGEWTSSFYGDKQYVLYSACNGLFIPGLIFTPSTLHSKHYTLNPQVYGIEDFEKSNGIRLDGIIFDTKRSQMATCSEIEIAHLAAFMKSHPELSIEVEVHVDGEDDTFCFNLSQARGQEIKKALISKGIDPDRIAVSGYGNSKTKRQTATNGVIVRKL